MLEEILDCTIAEARRDRATWDVSIMELKAFIALLYVRGFGKSCAWVVYRSCMSQENIPRRDFMLQLAHELRAEWMASKAPPLADLPFSGAGAEERRRMTCMVKAHCMQNKTFCKCVKCGDAVCGKCTAKVLSVCNNCV
ncbi:hypothetical protein JOQ06_005303 [Pogonophryne albipinna]|nr:hypothetical protein JOQ06_005303 [Pogonophryne albipinna]